MMTLTCGIGASNGSAQTIEWCGTLGTSGWYDVLPVPCGPDVCFLTNWSYLEWPFPIFPTPGDYVGIGDEFLVELSDDSVILALDCRAHFVLEDNLTVLSDSAFGGLWEYKRGEFTGLGTTTVEGELLLRTDETKRLNDGIFVNYGLVTWIDGCNLEFVALDFINNGTFDAHTNQTISGDDASLVNNGHFRKVGGADITRLSNALPFLNRGEVEVRAGKLLIEGGGESSGVFRVLSNAVIDIQNLPYSFRSGATISGEGLVRVVADTANITTNLSASNLELDTGSLTGTGTLTTTNLLSLAGDGTKTLTRMTLNNQGRTAWTQLGDVALDATTLNNDGVFEILNDKSLRVSASSTFNNRGTLRKSNSAGTSTLDAGLTLNHSGTVQVDTGRIQHRGRGVSSGPFVIAEGAAFEFSNVPLFTFAEATRFSGQGFGRVVDGSIIAIPDDVFAENFEIACQSAEATIRGDAALSVTGTCLITGDRTKHIDGVTLVNRGTIHWRGLGDVEIKQQTPVYNLGTFDAQNDQRLFGYGGAFENRGVFQKTGGTGTTTVTGKAFNNQEQVRVDIGTLSLNSGGGSDSLFEMGANATLAFPSGNYVLAPGSSLRGQGFAHINGGTLTIAGEIPADHVALSAGTLAGDNQISIHDGLQWSGGSMTGSGLTRIEATARLDIGGSQQKLAVREIRNEGTVVWTGSGVLLLGGGLPLDNRGVFEAHNDAAIRRYNGTGNQLINSGVFIKSDGVGTTTVDSSVAFNSTGIVEVERGTLLLKGGGTSSGSMSIAADAKLEFQVGYTLADGCVISGPGFARVPSGTLTVSGAVQVENLDLAGGYLSGSGALSIDGVLDWAAGSMNGTGMVQITRDARCDLHGSTDRFSTCDITNEGAVVWTESGDLRMGGGMKFTNEGLFDVLNDEVIRMYSGSGNRFDNSGFFTKSGGTGVTLVESVAFNNIGTVSVETGTLRLKGGGTNTGDCNLAAGTQLEVAANYTLGDGTAIGGPGLLKVTAGTLAVEGVATVENMEIAGGYVSGDGSLSIASTLEWVGGMMLGAGSATIQASGTCMIDGASDKVAARTLRNDGAVVWTGSGNLRIGGGVAIMNAGVLDIRNDQHINFYSGSDNRFINTGTIIKSLGDGITSVETVRFDNPGVVKVETGQLLISGPVTQHSGNTLTGGTWEVYGGATLDIASGADIAVNDASIRLSGAESSFPKIAALAVNNGLLALADQAVFSARSSFTNAGFLDIGNSGCDLEITEPGEGFVQNATASLRIGIAGTSELDHGHVHGGGSAVLDGRLEAEFSEGFQAEPGDSFVIVDADIVTGEFTEVSSTGLSQKLMLDVAYEADRVILHVEEREREHSDGNRRGSRSVQRIPSP